ncbi:lantibiotic dehydratase C-terminal domain-containing protein [Saccharibacillus alkalitolerans]|uniref:Thiopeptide-type bacteriocin biosynthesis domain-containing protein n=1 Tax=Saccharibacillus alkalitolerans TaxID=2705290 RepID=A0ABX0F3T5_9BACL|nr:lantibiotic dehydratase C-terminal domain-containing protein [Saccharibacillus alkalitolerans]NGZ75302.1 hypothetical protein [Saccharibacillus alkalitolerans]
MWHSFHAYIHDYSALDRYLQLEFPAFVKERIAPGEDWFFIRYWLGGPHIRLRLKRAEGFGAEEFAEAFGRSVGRFLEMNPVRLIDYERFYTDAMLAGEGITETYWKAHGTVEPDRYEPEYGRYGGANHMARSEAVFRAGSELALTLNTLAFPYRVLAACDLLHWSLGGPGAAESAFGRYAELWKSYRSRDASSFRSLKEAAVQRAGALIAADSPPERYRNYLDSLRNLGDLHEGVLFSHVHMMNNRIGVHPELEYELAALLAEEGEKRYARH